MKSCVTLIALLFTLSLTLSAQQLSDYSPKVSKTSLGKMKGAKKRIYIAKFNINFEVFKSASDYSHGGSTFGGGVRGDASAKAAVGLMGIDETELVKITDQLYEEYKADLAAAGYTFISPDEAAQTKAYEGWERKQGGSANRSQLPGVVTVRPTGFDYFVKRETKKGKEKTGFIANYPAVSKGLENAIVAHVDLTILFSENGKKYFNIGGVANVKIKTNMRLVDDYTITAPKKTIMKGGGIETHLVQSKVAFYSGKVGLASASTYEGTMKSPLEIENVIPEDKIKAVSVAKSDAMGTDWGVVRVYSAENVEDAEYRMFDIDSDLYCKAAYAASKKMIGGHTKGFIAARNK